MQELINELDKILSHLKKQEADIENSSSDLLRSTIEDVNSIIFSLMWDEADALDRISYLFYVNNKIQKFAEDGGWIDEYSDLTANIYDILGQIRCAQKRDPALFNNVKLGKYLNNNSYATCPGRLTISNEQWKDIKKFYELGPFRRLDLNKVREKIKSFISYGATEPAMVMSVNPLLIAAYAEDMDAVVMLKFPKQYAEKYNLKRYDKLISVNTFTIKGDFMRSVSKDIFCGKNHDGRFINFSPLIGQFLSKDTERMESYIKSIPESLWSYVRNLGEEYLTKHKGLTREGFYFIP